MNKKSIAIFKKLENAVNKRDKDILKNPLPYLEEAYKLLSEQRRIFEKITYSLSPDIVFDKANEFNIKPENFNGGDKIKIDAVIKILNDYLHSN